MMVLTVKNVLYQDKYEHIDIIDKKISFELKASTLTFLNFYYII